MKKILFGLGILAVIALTGCADVVNIQQCLPQSEAFGFWYGVWHGAISQFAFFCSLFDNSIAIYAVNNNGGWYNFGYIGGLGLMIKFIASTIKRINE